MTNRSLMWFRRDLRIGDLPALLLAGSDNQTVVPLFVIDPGFARAGTPQRALLQAILCDLDEQIRHRFGSRLLIRHGDPAVEVPAIAAALDASTVYVSRDYAPYGRQRDTAVAAALADQGRSLTGVGSPYAVDPGRVLKGDGTPYKVFTPFSKIWRQIGVEPPAPDPGDDMRWAPTSALDEHCHPLFDPPDPGCDLPTVGEASALDRWASFLDSERCATHERRSGASAGEVG